MVENKVINDIQASELSPQKKFIGNTKIQGAVPDNTHIIVVNGRLDIEGDIGNKVTIEFRFTRAQGPNFEKGKPPVFYVYIKGNTGQECVIKISKYIRGNVTITGDLGSSSHVEAKGLVEAKSIGEGCKVSHRVNFIGADITIPSEIRADESLRRSKVIEQYKNKPKKAEDYKKKSSSPFIGG
jgi:hypothetical protein